MLNHKYDVRTVKRGKRKMRCLFCEMVFMCAAVLAMCSADSCMMMTFAVKENGGLASDALTLEQFLG